MGWHKGLRLGGDGCEHALLREALTVGAATVLRLIKPGAADLATRQCKLRCDATRVDAGVYSMRHACRESCRIVASSMTALVEHTFLLLQYLHAIAVLWRGAGWAGAA